MESKEEIEPMDELEIEEELLRIQNIHESFDEYNPITYAIMLHSNKDRLNRGQINYLEMMIKKYQSRQVKIYNKWENYMKRETKVITEV